MKAQEFYKIKARCKEFPNPCAADPFRCIVLFDNDLLQRGPRGTFAKVNGERVDGIFIRNSEVEKVE